MTIEKAIQAVAEVFPFEGIVSRRQVSGTYRTVLPTILKWLKPPAKILDLGSGACDTVAILTKLGFQCAACDDLKDWWHRQTGNRDRIINFAEQAQIRFTVVDGESPLPYSEGEFDMVMLHHVLEHLHDSPRELLNDLMHTTTPQGILFITVPNAGNLRKRVDLLFGRTNLADFHLYYWWPGPWRSHVREYVRGDLVKLASYLDLEILELRACHNMLQVLPARVRPVWRVITAVCPGWRDTWLLVAKKRPDWKPRRSLDTRELEKIMVHPQPRNLEDR